jgi:hypothetical protein
MIKKRNYKIQVMMKKIKRKVYIKKILINKIQKK